MEKILALLHTDVEGKLPKLAFEVIAGTKELAGKMNVPWTIAVMGSKLDAEIQKVTGLGAEKVLCLDFDLLSQARYSTDIEAAVSAVKASEATLILTMQTSRFARILGGLAVRLQGKVDTKVSTVEWTGSALEAERWFYRQRMLARFARTAKTWILSFDSGSFAPVAAAAGASAVQKLDAPKTDPKSKVLRIENATEGEQTIKPEADLLFVAGAGWCKKQADGQFHIKEAEGLIKTVLQKAHASLGSTKSLVDQSDEGGEVISFMSHMNQVGQTGSTPRHQKGLSTCCHGEEPHTVGWRFINERRAISLDANCGWSQGKADVVYVADAFQVIQKLNGLL